MSVSVNYVPGKIARPLSNDDHISGIVFVDQAIPSGYIEDVNTGFSNVKRYTNLEQAEEDGITEDDALTALMWYHISEFFRVAPGATLYVMVIETLDDTEYVKFIQEQAEGNIRQVLVHGSVKYGNTMAAEVTSLQEQADELDSMYMPLHVFLEPGGETLGIPGSTFYDLSLFEAPNVSVLFGQDGAAVGNELFAALTESVGFGGAALGQTAKSAVHESIGWVQKGNISEGASGELDEPAFPNGDLLKNKFPHIETFDDYRHILLQKHRGIAGTYINYGYNCVEEAADLNSVERVRVVNKIKRVVRTALLPSLNSPAYVNPANGNLSAATIAYFEATASTPLNQMVAAGELSGFEVYIDPTQDVITTNGIIIQINLVPVGTAKNITVLLSYVVSI